MTDRRRAPRSVRRASRGLLVAVAALVVVPLPQAVAGPRPAGLAAAPETELRPSIAYEEAMAHADDEIAFTPGGRVEVPFEPVAGDRWTVDGGPPRALPAGRASGRAMAASPQGSRWADPAADAPGHVHKAPTIDGAPPMPSPGADPSAAPSAAPTDPATPSPDPSASTAPVDAPANVPSVPADGAAALAPTTSGSDVQAVSGLRRQVFGFLPYWELSTAPASFDHGVLSTIAYFSVGADKNGNLLKKNADGTTTTGWGGWTSSRMTNVITNAHRNGTRVVLTLSVFAWQTNQANVQKAILGSSTARLNLARQAAAAVRDRGADGVNLDFEPIVSGYEDEFVAFTRTMRAELNKIAPGYQLTFDTTGWIGNYPLEQLLAAGAADAVFIMGYDYRGASSGRAGSIDPLAGPQYDLTDTVKAYTARVPGSKVILGLPWYGRAWSTTSDALNATTQSGTKYGASAAVMYDTARSLAVTHGRRWDSVEKSPWIAYRRENCTATYGCVTSWRQVYYDDPTSLKARYDLVNRYGLRGAGIWALGYEGGRMEMYEALGDKFRDAATTLQATLSAPAFSPNGDGIGDTVSVRLATRGGSTWELRITPVAGGAAVRTLTGTGSEATVTWDGRNADGAVVPTGRYDLLLTARDASGVAQTRSFEVSLDLRAPVLGSSASPTSFSPNGDGKLDTARLAWTSDEPAGGLARIYRGTTLVRSWSVAAGSSGALTWDGRDAKGAVVADGSYTFRLDLRDTAGNLGRRDLPVVVDRTAGFLRWSRSFFPQDGDAYLPSSALSFRLARNATVSLRIVDRHGTTVRTIHANRSLPAGSHSWTWNGRNAAGAYVGQGKYRAVLTATSWVGTSTLTHDVYASAYRVSLSASTVSAGDTLTVTFSSVEPLSTRPTVRLAQPGLAAVTKTAVRLSDGRWRASFAVAAGPAGTASIRIQARDAAGRTNRQYVAVTIGS